MEQSECQQILAVLKAIVKEIELNGRELKALTSYNYRRAIPGSAEGQISFEYYNYYFDLLKENRKNLQKYTKLIRTTKKLMRK